MRYLIIPIFFFLSTSATAQVQSVELVASGLTCSMCSKAIFKSLSRLDFVSEVKVDIEKSSYILTFKSRDRVSIEEIREAVYDTGFAIETMQMTANFPNTKAVNEELVSLNGYQFKWKLAGVKNIANPQKVSIVNKEIQPTAGVYYLNF
ncbi:MAG: heavy-metal-associated domain-containing protein [Chitinophagia bacterium]|jgi:copper chaperone CopZ